MKNLLIQLSNSIRDSVRPWVVSAKDGEAISGEVVGRARSGDATFKIDEVAERCLTDFMEKADRPIAYLSEDKGLVMPGRGEPEWLLVVDPIDGSRNAKSGFEGCMVSIALARYSECPTLADVTHGLLHEIVGDRIFYADAETRTEIMAGDSVTGPLLSANDDLNVLRWSLTVPGRPASLVFGLMADLIDTSSVEGGFFSCNSTCYSVSRIVTGQQDAYVDVANRMVRDYANIEQGSCDRRYGHLAGFSSYDIAAAFIIARQAGVRITDAYGEPLDGMELLDVSAANLGSCVAAANAPLHSRILEYIEEHMESFESMED